MNNLPYTKAIYPTGSSYICDPPVLTTDIDYIVLTTNLDELEEWLRDAGFRTNFADYLIENFVSYKNENINYIVTEDPIWYSKMVTATKLAKKLNLLNKQQRIDLFDYIIFEEL